VSLYADDVVIFCHPNEDELWMRMSCVRSGASWTSLDRHLVCAPTSRSGAVSPIACSEEVSNGAAAVMGCQLAPYPVKYLGIPLAIRRLSAEAV